MTAARERRLRFAGLVEALPGVGDTGRLILCTRDGLQRRLRVADRPVPRFSPGTVRHTAVVAGVAVQLEREGRQVFSEREIFARERAAGKRIFSAAIAERRFHRPDLIVPADSAEAIEVELTAKAAPRLDGHSPSMATLDPGKEGRARPLRVFGARNSRDTKVD